MKVLVKTANMSREDWLKWRTRGIGGSDVSIIAGINPYKSVYQLWLEKIGQVEPEQTENEYVHFGSILESVVKKEFSERTGLKVRAKRMILQSSEYPFMLADLDGVVYENGEMCIFEAKTASAYKEDIWKKGIPPEYMLQIQHYMAVTGAKKTYIAALVGGNHFYWHEIPRDDVMIQKIILMEKYFWEELVLAGVEPIPDGSAATTEYIKQKYSFSNGRVVQLPKEVEELCRQYDEVADRLGELENRKAALANQLKNYLQDNEIGISGERRISWKEINKTSFDAKRLEQEQPEIYQAYLSKSHYRRFSVA